jgi:hypothetical protein
MHPDKEECPCFACEAKKSVASKPRPEVRIALSYHGDGRDIDDIMYLTDITYKEFAEILAKVQALWLRGIE